MVIPSVIRPSVLKTDDGGNPEIRRDSCIRRNAEKLFFRSHIFGIRNVLNE